MSLPYALLPLCRQQFLDPDGTPYAGGLLEFFASGGDTPAAVYSTAAGTVALGTSITLDSGGSCAAIYIAPGGLKVRLTDADGVVIWTQDVVEDVGLTFFDAVGEAWLEGGDSVTSGYTVLEADRFVTVASTGGADPCVITLPAATSHPSPVAIKNLGTVHIHLVPQGGDNIESLAQVYSIPAAVSPIFPTIWLMADGGSNWWIVASHGIPAA
jgi:hypothetical protein